MPVLERMPLVETVVEVSSWFDQLIATKAKFSASFPKTHQPFRLIPLSLFMNEIVVPRGPFETMRIVIHSVALPTAMLTVSRSFSVSSSFLISRASLRAHSRALRTAVLCFG